jgi:hypothetical protein
VPARGRPVHLFYSSERSADERVRRVMLPKTMPRLVTAAALVAVLCSWAHAAPARPRLAVLFDASAASLPQAEIRAAIAAELDALLVDDATSAEGVLSVARSEQGRIVMTYRPLQATVVRSVPEPPDSTDTPALLALVAGNLVRNEALELLPAGPPPPTPARPAPIRRVSPSELIPPFPPEAPDAPPEAAILPPPPRRTSPSELVSPFSSGQVPAAADVRQARPRGKQGPVERRLFLMMGIGSGLGLSRGTPDMNPNYLDGTAVRPLNVSGAHRVAGYHVAPEVGFLWRPDVMIGAQLRLQHVLGATELHHPSCGASGVCEPPSTAVALLARAGWLQPLGESVRLHISAAAGLGRVRHLVLLADSPIAAICGPPGNRECKDTVTSGLLLAGPGVALYYQLTPRAWVFGSLQALMSVPRPMLNFDGAGGLALRL